uniref:2'-5'-oligoadenylate synthetase 2 n=1 Tax=Homo sapiens TaxID=9606 RepID=A0A7P0T9B5_HUMAN
MGNGESQLSSVPAQKLGWFIQEYLKPYEECQTLIDEMVNTICDVLQEPEQFPLVQGVAIIQKQNILSPPEPWAPDPVSTSKPRVAPMDGKQS